MVTASDRSPVNFILTEENRHDSPSAIVLLEMTKKSPEQKYVLIDRAYGGKNVRTKAVEKRFIPVVPPKQNTRKPWKYDNEKI